MSPWDCVPGPEQVGHQDGHEDGDEHASAAGCRRRAQLHGEGVQQGGGRHVRLGHHGRGAVFIRRGALVVQCENIGIEIHSNPLRGVVCPANADPEARLDFPSIAGMFAHMCEISLEIRATAAERQCPSCRELCSWAASGVNTLRIGDWTLASCARQSVGPQR